MNNANLSVGSIVTNPAAFSTFEGVTFAAGTRFEVISVGEVNSRAQALTPCGSLVWIAFNCYFFNGKHHDMVEARLSR